MTDHPAQAGEEVAEALANLECALAWAEKGHTQDPLFLALAAEVRRLQAEVEKWQLRAAPLAPITEANANAAGGTLRPAGQRTAGEAETVLYGSGRWKCAVCQQWSAHLPTCRHAAPPTEAAPPEPQAGAVPEQVQRDARRYRFLRGEAVCESGTFAVFQPRKRGNGIAFMEEGLDAAIDAAIEQERSSG